MDTFIHAFRTLPTSRARQHALDALLAELNSYEWRAIQAQAAERPLQCDIIGRLPLELVVLIFAHLDIAHPYRLQRVSRTWLRALSSPLVLEAGLNSWYNKFDLRQTDTTLYRNMAKSIQAFRTAKPTRHFLLRLRRCVDDLILTGDTVIWQPIGNDDSTIPARNVCLFNLSSWSFRELHPNGREQVHSMAASDEIVAIMTYSNKCHVWELHGTKSHWFVLPSSDYRGTETCRGRTVACAALIHDQIAVYIWQFDTQQGQSFQFSRSVDNFLLGGPFGTFHANLRPLWLLLQPMTSSIIIITSTQHITDESIGCTGPLISTRLTYRGEFIDRCSFPLADKYRGMELYGACQLVQTSHRGCFAVPTACMFHTKDNRKPDFVCLELDESLNQLMIMDEQPELLLNRWNDTSCYGDVRTTCTGTSVGWLTTTVANTSGFSRNLVTLGRLEDKLESPVLCRATNMNEKYIVHNLHAGLAVFCFDQRADGAERHGHAFDEGEVSSLDFEREAAGKADS